MSVNTELRSVACLRAAVLGTATSAPLLPPQVVSRVVEAFFGILNSAFKLECTQERKLQGEGT